jgi:hypothetical protein
MLASETAINALSPPAPSSSPAPSSPPAPSKQAGTPTTPETPGSPESSGSPGTNGSPGTTGTSGLTSTRIPPHQDVFWASVQNCLTAVANISKACWGEEGEYRKERKPLRKSLGIKKDNPLKPLSMRNNFEHFDEQIDEWFSTSKNRIHVDRIIGPANIIGGVSTRDMFRVFDPTTADVVFWGERYPLKSIMDEVTRLYPLARSLGDKPA